MSPRATCECGQCYKCKRRVYMREYLRRNAERNRERVRSYRDEHVEEIRERDRERGHRVYNVLKERARRAVTHAIEKGKLVPQPCEVCGEFPRNNQGRRLVHAHHDDYGAPLDVRWLCSRCHGVEHQIYA